MAYNWKMDLEKLYRVYDKAVENGDTAKQQELSEEIRQIEDIISEMESI